MIEDIGKLLNMNRKSVAATVSCVNSNQSWWLNAPLKDIIWVTNKEEE